MGRAFVLVALVCLLGCGSLNNSTNSQKRGFSAIVKFTLPEGYSRGRLSSRYVSSQRAMPAYITRATLSITGESISPIIADISLDTGKVSGSIIPGTFLFSVTVGTNLGVTFTGATVVNLKPNTRSNINIDLKVADANSGGNGSGNNGSGDSGSGDSASGNSGSGDSGSGSNGSGDSGSGNSGSGNNGSGDSGSGDSASGNSGSGDSGSGSSGSGDNGAGSGDSGDSGQSNTNPIIQEVSVDISNPHVGQSVTLNCDAEDPDGDKLTYAWSGSDGWSASGQEPRYTVQNLNPVSFTCNASDGNGGSASGSVFIAPE